MDDYGPRTVEGAVENWLGSPDGPWLPLIETRGPVPEPQPSYPPTGDLDGNSRADERVSGLSEIVGRVTTTLDSESTTFDSISKSCLNPSGVHLYHAFHPSQTLTALSPTETLQHNPLSSSGTTRFTTYAADVRRQGSDATRRGKVPRSDPEYTKKTAQGGGDDEEPCTYYMADPEAERYKVGHSHEECSWRGFARTSQHNQRKHPPARCATCGGEYKDTSYAKDEHMETCPAQASNQNLGQLPKPATKAKAKTPRTYTWVERFKRDHGPDLSRYPLAESFVEFGKATVGLPKVFAAFMQEDKTAAVFMQYFINSSQFKRYTAEHEDMKTFIQNYPNYDYWNLGEIVLKTKWLPRYRNAVPAPTVFEGAMKLQQNLPCTAPGPVLVVSEPSIAASGTRLEPSNHAEVNHLLVQANPPMSSENPPSPLSVMNYYQPETSSRNSASTLFHPLVDNISSSYQPPGPTQSSTYKPGVVHPSDWSHAQLGISNVSRSSSPPPQPGEEFNPSSDGSQLSYRPPPSREHSGRYRAAGPYRPRRGAAVATHDQASSSRTYHDSPKTYTSPYPRFQQEASKTGMPHSGWPGSRSQQAGQSHASQNATIGYPGIEQLRSFHTDQTNHHVEYSLISTRNRQGVPNIPQSQAHHDTGTGQNLTRGMGMWPSQSVSFEERHHPASNNMEYAQNNNFLRVDSQLNEFHGLHPGPLPFTMNTHIEDSQVVVEESSYPYNPFFPS